MRPLLWSVAALILAVGPVLAEPVRPTAGVPFVGCRSDGQMGPEPAPRRPAKTPRVPAGLAGRLAYYASAYNGVLAPRGWTCFGLYGSNGSTLFVTPKRIPRPFDSKIEGPAVQLSVSSGETSGRFEAAQVAARLFPERRKFVEDVIAEGIEPASSFPFGPFPHDVLKRQGRDVVEFETPAHQDGMGTKSRLVKSGEPIHGVAMMDDENDATVLAVRLDPSMRGLTPVILDAALAAAKGK
jgi:hypothetical protein